MEDSFVLALGSKAFPTLAIICTDNRDIVPSRPVFHTRRMCCLPSAITVRLVYGVNVLY